MTAPRPDRLDCLGVPVARLGWNELFAWFLDRIRGPGGRGGCKNLFIANAHTLNLAWVDAAAREALRSADLVLNDGVGLSIYSRIHRRPFGYNFNGTDLVPRLLQECAERGVELSVFLFGARPGRAAAAARRIAADYPSVRVAGVLPGYPVDDAAAVAAVNAARPDLLLVALGNPLQERWLARHAPALDVKVAMGVGALFDFMSGSVPRAPRLLRTLRLEWLFRLLLEPRRMFRRYVIGIPLFLWRALRYRPAPGRLS